MCAYIRALYQNLTAKVRVNGQLSNAFSFSQQYQGGLPFIPPLFLFEYFLNRLVKVDIKGIRVKNYTFKLAVFVADSLLFLTDSHITLPNLLQAV